MSKFSFAVGYLFDVRKTIKDARMLFHVKRVVSAFNEVMGSLSNELEFNSAIEHVHMIGRGHRKFGMEKENFQEKDYSPVQVEISVK